MTEAGSLFQAHCGYEGLKTFQMGRLIYDITVGFCDRFVERRSRTHDQMVQAGRSGTQNIAEGSADSGTSKKIEMKLTNIAFGSLHELKLDFEDYLRQRGLLLLDARSPAMQRFKKRRIAAFDEFQKWVREELAAARASGQDQKVFDGVRKRHETSIFFSGHSALFLYLDDPAAVTLAILSASGVLALLNMELHWLNKQKAAQGEAFVETGGFTERMYQTRRARREGGA